MKQYKETVKTIALTIALTSIVAFVAGVHYEQTNTKQLQGIAKSIVTPTQAASK